MKRVLHVWQGINSTPTTEELDEWVLSQTRVAGKLGHIVSADWVVLPRELTAGVHPRPGEYLAIETPYGGLFRVVRVVWHDDWGEGFVNIALVKRA